MALTLADFERPVDQAIADLAELGSERGFVFEDDLGELRPLPFAELALEAGRIAGALQAHGLSLGDRVAIVLPRNEHFVVSFLGAVRGGLIPVPVSHPVGFGGTERYLDVLLNQLRDAGAAALVTEKKMARVFEPLKARHTRLAILFFEDLEGDGSFEPGRASLDDICFLQFTSGSTGRRRGVTVRHGNVAANARSITGAFQERGLEPGLTPAASWLPLFHDLGLIGSVLCPAYTGNPVHLLSPLTFLKRPQRWLRAISETRAGVSFAPNFAYALCARRLRPQHLDGLDLTCWKLAGCGAEPIRPRDLRDFARLLEPVGFDPKALTCAYGMAEATLAVSFDGPARGLEVDRVDPERLRQESRAEPVAEGEPAVEIPACGRPLLGMEVRAFAHSDPTGQHPLPERSVGELRLRGPSVTRGYWGAPDDDPELFADGWLRTGDEGYLADGRVYVSGRLKDTLIIHGQNYRPQHVEWAAGGVDGVLDRKAAAISVRDADGGERVVVLVETLAAAPAARGRIARAVKRRIFESLGLAGTEVMLVRRGSLPMTTSGKLQRFRARELYLGGELS
jgi:fatty-acyl-CoA synthase